VPERTAFKYISNSVPERTAFDELRNGRVGYCQHSNESSWFKQWEFFFNRWQNISSL